jgi:ribonuclease P protein component
MAMPSAAAIAAESGPGLRARLTRRAEFVRAASGRKIRTNGLTLQMIPSSPGGPPRFGLTVTKKTGSAVVRNRIRRRLRAALESATTLAAKPGHDYVIVARTELLTMPYPVLVETLGAAFRDIHAGKHAGKSLPRSPAGASREPTRT